VGALLLALAAPAHAQVGDLIWEDDFNTLDNWLKVTGNGSWGWGNGELEYYKNENVDVAGVPGEPGNNALRIVAKNESGPGIVDQWGNPLNYTSGKVVTKSFVTVKYGMIEARVLVPNLNLGGWPAVWMLGTANVGWPGSGEVDLMEMGAGKAFRDLHDTHNGGNGLNNSTVNQMVGANAIWQSPSAVGPGNPLGAASLANDPTDVYDAPTTTTRTRWRVAS
jgi:beta-glucanase (GH16 family)